MKVSSNVDICTVVSVVCVCQAIMAAPDFVAFKETPDAEKPVPPCGHKTREVVGTCIVLCIVLLHEHIQWNTFIVDTMGPLLCVPIIEVSVFRRLPVYFQ